MKKTICRSRKSGHFGHKGKCGAWKKQRVTKRIFSGLQQLLVWK